MFRILNRQRQMAEQGRLRLGYTTEASNGKVRPVRSETWIVTSHSEEHIHAAAQMWGGQIERWQPMGNGAQQWRVITGATVIDAILPPGDPLSQAYELWSKGGCQRRCDGVTEELGGSPCICLAQFGDRWYEQPTGTVCDSKSRLKVILPDMPGIGVWRMETGSFYATDEIAGIVDLIRASVGEQQLVPVQLRIEQRTRVSGGQTRHFVVPVVEPRGVTAGQILSGHVERQAVAGSGSQQQIGSGLDAPAIASGSRPDYLAEAQAATTSAEVYEIAKRAKDNGHLQKGVDDELYRQLGEIGRQLKAGEQAGETDGGAVSGEDTQAPSGAGAGAAPPSQTEQDPDVLWQQILAVAGEQGMTTTQLRDHFKARAGVAAEEASAAELAHYLDQLKADKETAA